jgi:hypothetical protein
MSLIFAVVFSVAALFAYLARYEMAILPTDKRIRLRTGTWPLLFQRYVEFSEVHAVRLTLSTRKGRTTESQIEVLCDNEDIECPATQIPRQQALFLAILLNAQLIKVSGDAVTDQGERII